MLAYKSLIQHYPLNQYPSTSNENVFMKQRKVLGSQVLTEKENRRQSPQPSDSVDVQGRENTTFGGVSIALLHLKANTFYEISLRLTTCGLCN